MRAGMRNGVLIRHAVLPESHIVKAADGTLYTSALRTGIDCARGLDPVSAFIVLNSALRRSLDHAIGRDGRQLTSHQLTDLASDPECARAAIAQLHAILRGCGGHGLRAPRLAMRFVDPRLETALEGLSWWRFNERGFLIPVPQQWVRGASGCLYRVDFGCGRVVGEADGAVKYKDPKDLQQEKSRQTDIELGGHPVVRWGWIEMWHRPDSVIEALRRAAG